ncbi:MAG: hypothetical protein ACPGF7_03875 [Pontibacterium sp.]
MTHKRTRLKRWLIRRADNHRQNLIILLTGFCTFFVGLLLIAVSEYLLGSSLLQEALALIGLIIVGIGIILAAFGYICLSILRLFRFLSDD